MSEFRGEYDFLSNFYESEFPWRNELYPTAEHAFQAAKAICMLGEPHEKAGYEIKVRQTRTPSEAKALGRTVKIDLDHWEAMKVQYMREIIHNKFSRVTGLAGRLINTGAMLLVEGNDWGDTFWGRSRNADGRMVGINTLGTLLMEERGYWLYSSLDTLSPS